ncbi:MAG TPA: hypothetical protein PL077_06930, partial [Treponemataceae bacterium]|nr:hypothetical protein [Treponemataceae bacterium]
LFDFPQYAALQTKEVCEKSGLLPSPDCRETMEEIFVPGTVPEKTCNVCAGVIGGVIVWKPPRIRGGSSILKITRVIYPCKLFFIILSQLYRVFAFKMHEISSFIC